MKGARTLEEVIASRPPEEQAKIQARTAELMAEVRGLGAIRKIARMSQAQIAAALGKKQPSVHKMESQADYYVSTLERFVEAAGGTLEIKVTLPGHEPVRLRRFADLKE